jgi:hypothetical protein
VGGGLFLLVEALEMSNHSIGLFPVFPAGSPWLRAEGSVRSREAPSSI